MNTISRRCVVIVILMTACLVSCALEPKVLRAKLDECDYYNFDALIHRRARDGAVVRVLCVPEVEEMDIQYKQPAIIPQLIKRLVPLLEP